MKQEAHIPTANVKTLSLPLVSTEVQWTAKAYHELAEVPVREIDLLESVEDNRLQLEELQARLRFMMREVKYLLKL